MSSFSLLWHPHQGLWNWRLLAGIRRCIPLTLASKPMIELIVLLDTAALWLRAVATRVALLGPRKIVSRARVPRDVPLLYFDFGTHRQASELAWMADRVLPRMCPAPKSYGFEANRDSFEQARLRFIGSENVALVNKALCRVPPPGGRIRLYKAPNGLGDSLYRQSENYEEVEALRFSDWLRDNHIDLRQCVCLLRMNIEGAEFDVIQDLVDSGIANQIDGYFGMWDDVSKIDPKRDAAFRALLAEHRIKPFTFNGRDFSLSLRMKSIEYHIHTCVQLALRQLRRRERGLTRDRERALC